MLKNEIAKTTSKKRERGDVFEQLANTLADLRSELKDSSLEKKSFDYWYPLFLFEEDKPYRTIKLTWESSKESKIADWLVGLSLSDTIDQYFVSTFFNNDAKAIESDWQSSASDLAYSFFANLKRKPESFQREFLLTFLRLYIDELVKKWQPSDQQLKLPLGTDSRPVK